MRSERTIKMRRVILAMFEKIAVESGDWPAGRVVAPRFAGRAAGLVGARRSDFPVISKDWGTYWRLAPLLRRRGK
jgi:hypothetical protein